MEEVRRIKAPALYCPGTRRLSFSSSTKLLTAQPSNCFARTSSAASGARRVAAKSLSSVVDARKLPPPSHR
jgi:hypothetical protein